MSINTLSTTSQKIRTLNEIPLFVAIIFVAEQLLGFLPNISLTPLLFAVYFSARPLRQSFYLVSIYMLLEIAIWGLGLWVAPMWLGWFVWVLMVKSKLDISIATKGVFFAVIYGIMFMPLTVIVYGIDPWAYLIADIPFQISMMASNIVTLTFLYIPLQKALTYYSDYGKIIW
jgi:hypothetical protein